MAHGCLFSAHYLIGLFLGGNFTFASLSLVVASLTAFLLRQPITIAVKAYAGRRARTDLPAAFFWIGVYGFIAITALIGLIGFGFGYLFFLVIPGIPVFAWHLWLISKREERRQINVEIIATGVLSLAAPATYWVGVGHYDPLGWWLWILVWLQTAASIVYAYLRLEQRELAESAVLRDLSKGLIKNDLWRTGDPRVCLHNVQLHFHAYARAGVRFTTLSLPRLLGTME